MDGLAVDVHADRRRSLATRLSEVSEVALLSRLSHQLANLGSVQSFSSVVGIPELKTFQDKLGDFVESVSFNAFIVAVVLMDFIFFFLEADKTTFDAIETSGAVALGISTTTIFTFEMVLKFGLYQRGMFTSMWNALDLVLAIGTVILMCLEVTVGSETRDQLTADDNLTESLFVFCDGPMIFRLVRVVRMSRLFHLIRAIRASGVVGASRTGEVRLPGVVCIDVLSRAIRVLELPRVKDFSSHLVSVEDVSWVLGVLQSNQVYFPKVQLDHTLQPEIKELLGAAPKFAAMNEQPRGISRVQSVSCPSPPDAMTRHQSFSVAVHLSALPRWELEIATAAGVSSQRCFAATAYHLFHRLGFVAHFGLKTAVLGEFVVALEERLAERAGEPHAWPSPQPMEMAATGVTKGERTENDTEMTELDANANPFYNHLLATETLCNVAFFLINCRLGDRLSPIESLSLVLAACVNHVRHPGYNNTFLARSAHPLARRYNDRNVLQNHHLAEAFALLKNSEFDFLDELMKEDKAQVRDKVIKLVLATDPLHHHEIVSTFASKLIGPEGHNLDTKKPADRLLLMKLLLCAASQGWAAKSSQTFDLWHNRRMRQFYEQGDREKQLGLSESMFMDRSQGLAAEVQCQIGHLNLVVSPLFECVAELLLATQDDNNSTVASDLRNAVAHNLAYAKEKSQRLRNK